MSGPRVVKDDLGTHKLAFDCERRDRRDGVDTGRLDGNAVHEAFVEVVRKIDPAFAITTIVNDAGEVVDLFAAIGSRRIGRRAMRMPRATRSQLPKNVIS